MSAAFDLNGGLGEHRLALPANYRDDRQLEDWLDLSGDLDEFRRDNFRHIHDWHDGSEREDQS